ncbi:hypothetical protein [Aquipuribacter sp. SD81]|uniref:aggregation-promoting factor C-terminal-like domain-containing protein n=1 Tax=Aquipuribacter sp. SD81 TaxID=3127703 RepID=UPI0030199E83
MTRHLTILPDRPRPSRRLHRAGATAGLTVAALALGVGGWAVTTAPTLATDGDRVAVGDLLAGEPAGAAEQAAVAARTDEQASRSQERTAASGLPTSASQAQAWARDDAQLHARLAAEEAEREAAREAAAEAEREAAEEEAARLAAQEEAERKAAEEEAARVAAEEEAARVAAEEEAARLAAEEEAAEAAAAAEREAAARAADPGSNRALGEQLMYEAGFSGDQWSCLDSLWQKESGWSHTADNPTSSAYGIPQALPGRKMSSHGADWETNPATQIRWGLSYIADVYGSPCAAWQHSQSHNWY